MSLETEKIPKLCQEKFTEIKNRVNDIASKYGSLANWGKPIYQDIIEIACIYYVNSKLNMSLDKLAKWLGLDKTSLYKLVKRVEDGQKVSIFDKQTNTIVQLQVTPQDLINKVEELITPRAKVIISDIFESAIIREFLSKPIEKRAKSKGKPIYLTDSQKKETLRYISRLIEYFKSKGMTTNPDLWNENDVYNAVVEIFQDPHQRYKVLVALRRIPQWRNWFEGKIGAVTKVVRPKVSYISYEHYVKLKDMVRKGLLSENEFLVIWLHLTTGAREGWGVHGVSESTKLEYAKSSLCGLKWSKLVITHDSAILYVYESKTDKEWETDLTWLDQDPINMLLKYRSGKSDSIIEDLTGFKTIKEFKSWYTELCKKVSELLNLPFTLRPHDMRRSHLAILAEMGVPLEVACGGLMGFGVGWEDLKTAFIFYLRLSRHAKQKIIQEIRQRQTEISKSIQ